VDDGNPPVSAASPDENLQRASQVEPLPATPEPLDDALVWRRMDLPGMDEPDERE
jgi:hypothetical protein